MNGPRTALATVAAVALAAGIYLARATPAAAPPDAPNVLLVVVDTLRADALSCYGSPFETSPAVDSLAEGGVLFERAIAASGMTGPSHASIMTGLYPAHHSMGYSNAAVRLGNETRLAESFANGGYDTAAFVGNFNLRRGRGFARGFAHYDDAMRSNETNRSTLERNAIDTISDVLAWLREPRERPIFLWVHYQDPHGPYTPPAPWDVKFLRDVESEAPLRPSTLDDLPGTIPSYQVLPGLTRPGEYRQRYDGEVGVVDRTLGELLAVFERVSGERPTIVLFTADHGEAFGEEDYYFVHGHTVMPELVHVPMILKGPGLRSARRRGLVSHVDVMPTLLEMAGLPVPEALDGISWLPYLRSGDALPPERKVVADLGFELAIFKGDRFARINGPPLDSRTRTRYSLGRASREGTAMRAGDVREMRTYRWTGRGEGAPAETELDVRGFLTSYWEDEALPGTPLSFSREEKDALRAIGYISE